MRDFRPDSGIRGVILNRVSPMLYPRLKEAIEGETGVTVYGYLPNLPGCALESRHLGLVTAAEVAGLRRSSPPWPPRRRKRGHRRPAGPGGLRPGAGRRGPALPPRWRAARHRRGPGQSVLLLLRRRPGAAGGAGGRAGGVLSAGGRGASRGYLRPLPGGGYPELFAGALAANAPCGRRCAPPWRGCPPWPSAAGSSTSTGFSDGEGRTAHGGALPAGRPTPAGWAASAM
ncbi:MAG: hypothetical protein ACLRIS_02445 [Flavonifractor plautii]